MPLNFLRAKDVRITRRGFACANTFAFICFGSQWSCSRVGRAVVSSSVDRVPPSTSCSQNRLRSGLPITCQRLCASLHAVCQPSRSQQPPLTPCFDCRATHRDDDDDDDDECRQLERRFYFSLSDDDYQALKCWKHAFLEALKNGCWTSALLSRVTMLAICGDQ